MAPTDIPSISTAAMIEVDRIMVEELGITLIQMMENAGSKLASLARDAFLNGDSLNKRVRALAGSGAKGGGVLAAARYLFNRGADVSVYTTWPHDEAREDTLNQLETLRKMGARLFTASIPPEDEDVELILDGIIGYSINGAPRRVAAELIRSANASKAPVLSMDVPSGLDAATGEVYEPAIKAAATMTLVLPKKGLYAPAAGDITGELYLADIGVPPGLYSRVGIGRSVDNIFTKETIIRLA